MKPEPTFEERKAQLDYWARHDDVQWLAVFLDMPKEEQLQVMLEGFASEERDLEKRRRWSAE
jgi:hypothetical protein